MGFVIHLGLDMLPGDTDRRQFIKHGAIATVGGGASLGLIDFLQAQAPKLKKNNKALIILNMGGGASTLDLFTPLYDHPNNGEFKAIKTTVAGMELQETLPNLAKQAKHFAIIRSLSTTEGDHARGTTLMQTGFAPNPKVQYPVMGSMTSHQFREADGDLPSYVAIGSAPSNAAGFLGAKYGPLYVANPGIMPEKLAAPRDAVVPPDPKANPKGKGGVAPKPAKERPKTAKEREAEKAAAATAARIKELFSLSSADDEKILAKYGNQPFGRGCLLARKLIQAGTRVVSVNLGGWDHHNGIFNALPRVASAFDMACATLFEDLQTRGMLGDTVVLFTTEFSRTPRINTNAGRDHYPSAWSIILGGGSIKGGQVYGSLDKAGETVKDSKVSVNDIYATVYKALGIDPSAQVRDNFDRQVTISGEGGKVIEALSG